MQGEEEKDKMGIIPFSAPFWIAAKEITAFKIILAVVFSRVEDEMCRERTMSDGVRNVCRVLKGGDQNGVIIFKWKGRLAVLRLDFRKASSGRHFDHGNETLSFVSKRRGNFLRLSNYAT